MMAENEKGGGKTTPERKVRVSSQITPKGGFRVFIFLYTRPVCNITPYFFVHAAIRYE